jgi:RHS repeat-associated protein
VLIIDAVDHANSRLTEVEAWSYEGAPPPRTNVALSSNGSVATASSTYSGYPFSPGATIDGEHKGLNWLNGGGWNDATTQYPDWLEVDFSGSKTIDEIDVYTVQDNYANPIEPTDTTTFSTYGNTAFEVQYWNGSAFVDVPGGNVTGNNKVWRKFNFSAITTSKIRVLINDSADHIFSRLTEVEAWTATSGSSSAQIHWLVADHLGTPRMIFDQSGALANMNRHDYLPFGEEIGANVGGRSSSQGYTLSDNVRQKFTSKERDIETGLDYFLARYFGSSQGRFTSPDEFEGGPDELFVHKNKGKQALPYAEVSQPQSLNKYTYVYNNPLRFIDPDGHCGEPSGLKPGGVGICVASYIESTFVPGGPGRGDGRGPNGQGGTSRIEVRVIVDPNKGTITKTDETMGRSGIFLKGLGPKGSGGVQVSQLDRDSKGNLYRDQNGNVYFQISQHGVSSTPAGWLGSIDNHLNMVVSQDLRVVITSISTARGYPSLEVYKYTMDAKGNVTTTLILDKRESGNILDLGKKEKPVQAEMK